MQSTMRTLAPASSAQCALHPTRIAAGPIKPFAAPVPSTRKRQNIDLAVFRNLSVAANASSSAQVSTEGNFTPVMRPEDLPKGVRKEVRVQGKNVLLFWYRNEIYAIEARSPAEGAYSEGFIKSKFTQDYCIECPTTGSLFSLKDGSIVSWYPNNPVLRLLTPADTCRKMEIYPVQITQDAIGVDVSSAVRAGGANVSKGGSDTSLENNNVYGLEPRVEEGGDGVVAEVATLVVGSMAVLSVLAVSVAVFKYVTQ